MPKILLVEDDNNLREIYGARLEAEGYEIVSASDGEEALATTVRERPDLIISDIMMPKISGFQMLDILRSTPETKDIKVIVMTALSQEEDKRRGEQLGADHYVVKSQVTLDDMVVLVREVLASSPAANPPIANDAQAQGSTPSQSGSTATNIPVTTATQPQADDNTAASSSAAQDATVPPLAAADESALVKEVEQFVATSPLMNGIAPRPAAPANVASPAAAVDKPAAPPQENISNNSSVHSNA